MWNVLWVILAVVILICVWVMIYDSNRFVVREYSFVDPRIRKPCRAVVLADLHNKKYGKDNEMLLEAIQSANPDMVFVAGDMLNAKRGAKTDTALQLMEKLAAEYPVYYGNGNHEYRLKLYPEVYGDLAEQYDAGLRRLGVRLLVNEHVGLQEYGFCVYGLEMDRFYYKRFWVRHMENAYLENILGKADKTSYTVLLAHNPDYFPLYAAWGADLTLSGHVHGGIVRLPFGGRGVLSPNVRFFPEYDGGIFHIDHSTMVVSRGLGMHTIPFRLFNPGELLVLDFNPEV